MLLKQLRSRSRLGEDIAEQALRLLSRHANSNDIVTGTPVGNRLKKELEPLVGFFVSALSPRTDCWPGRSFRDYLAHIKSVNLDAQANQDVSLEYLVERLKPVEAQVMRLSPDHVTRATPSARICLKRRLSVAGVGLKTGRPATESCVFW